MTSDKRVAVVVGGSGNIGSAIISGLLQEGFQVAVITRGQHSLDALFRSPFTQQGQLQIFQSDMTIEKQVSACFKDITRVMNHINILIYAAGLAPDPECRLATCSMSTWTTTLNTYATGFFLCLRESLGIMKRGGHIVALSSAVTRFQSNALPPIYAGHYAASKAALNELCKWGRREAHEHGILLSRLAPGAVDTPFHRTAPTHMRSPALLPLAVVTDKIISAVMHGVEIDEELIA